jgi:hypothetical protein
MHFMHNLHKNPTAGAAIASRLPLGTEQLIFNMRSLFLDAQRH